MYTPPLTLPVDPDRIPPELKALPGWVCWEWEFRPGKDGEEGKWTKPPINPCTGRRAKPNNPATGGTFAQTYQWMHANGLPGLGVMLTVDDPYVVIDLDDVITDGKIAPPAEAILCLFDTYAEPSPTGTGLHIIVQCREIPHGRIKKNGFEVYWQTHYITVTGHPLQGYDVIQDRTQLFLPWHAALSAEPEKPAPGAGGTPSPRPASSATPALTAKDQEVISACRQISGEKFARLYDFGDLSDYDDDDSTADAGLVGIFAKVGVTEEEDFDRLFRSSALMRPKWERADYRRLTIDFALRTVIPGKSTLSKAERLQRENEELRQQVVNAKAAAQSNGEVLQLIGDIRRNPRLRNLGDMAVGLFLEFLSREAGGKKPPYQHSMAKAAKAAGKSYPTGRRHIRQLAEEEVLVLDIVQVPVADPETGEIITYRNETYLTPVGSARDFALAVAALSLRFGWGGKRPGAFGRTETAKAQPVEVSEVRSRTYLGKVIRRRGGFPSPGSLYGDPPSAAPAA